MRRSAAPLWLPRSPGTHGPPWGISRGLGQQSLHLHFWRIILEALQGIPATDVILHNCRAAPGRCRAGMHETLEMRIVGRQTAHYLSL